MPVSRQRSASFDAPMGRSVRIWSILLPVILVALMIIMPLVQPPEARWAAYLAPGILGLILAATALFCVRGFTVRRGELLIRRLLWVTRIPLDGLNGGWADPDAMRRSIRSAGNGGFLAYTGWFWNKKLGGYRAYVTDPARAVVLEIGERKLVVSPDRPASFLRALGLDSGDKSPD